ncbi:hypothetical protein NHQ30_008794 [Ciborinia camelliae]|nr:hypothetical protein NHQ30_008794 [Ciborinia camelliae]
MLFFSNLPTELRIKIWEHALPGGRNIEIHPVFTGRREITWKVVHCQCRCNFLPSIAHVNTEARAVFLKHFTTCFDTYIQWKNDTILVTAHNLGFDVGSKKLEALDRIFSENSRSSELSSFAVTTNCTWVNHALPQFLKCRTPSNKKTSEPRGVLNSEDTALEFLAVSGTWRRTGLDGLKFEFFDEPLGYEERFSRLKAQQCMIPWRARWDQEGEESLPKYRIAMFQRNAPNCFKDA